MLYLKLHAAMLATETARHKLGAHGFEHAHAHLAVEAIVILFDVFVAVKAQAGFGTLFNVEHDHLLGLVRAERLCEPLRPYGELNCAPTPPPTGGLDVLLNESGQAP